MKKLKNTIIILSILLTSCSGFLDEVDQTKFVPSKADHYAALMLKEFNQSPTVMTGVQYMTDEIQETAGKVSAATKRSGTKPLYTWQKDIELDMETGERLSTNTAWKDLYRDIAVVNYVIEEIDHAEGSREEINAIKGEAYFIRAWCYFNLTNLYGEPWMNEEQARRTLGIPLRTDIGINTTYDKNMLYDCYQLIEQDLEKAIYFLAEGKERPSIYHPNEKACHLLWSRVKLYKKEYELVVTEASKVIDGSYLQRMNLRDSTFIDANNPEILYSYAMTSKIISFGDLVVNPDLLNSYDEADVRKNIFFRYTLTDEQGNVTVTSTKGESYYTTLGYCNLRVAEAYLNRAEAYACLGRLDEACSDMLELLKNRYSDVSALVMPSEQKELIRFIRQERFKELCFEECHRWFDLRRMEENERPEIVHRFTIMDVDGNKIGVETYKLLKNDRNYTLSVPYEEKDNNPFIYDYERFDKLPDYDAETVF